MITMAGCGKRVNIRCPLCDKAHTVVDFTEDIVQFQWAIKEQAIRK
jgi:hypothetical protein